MSNLLKIRNIRKYLTRDACKTLVVGLVLSHLDYCNSILISLPECTLKPFIRVQNMAAKIILKKSRYHSSSEALRELHWLPIRARIQYKILSLMHKATYGVSPEYLKNLLTLRPTGGRLRSSSEELIYIVPRVKLKTFAQRSFSMQGPLNWNTLPVNIRMEQKSRSL